MKLYLFALALLGTTVKMLHHEAALSVLSSACLKMIDLAEPFTASAP